MVVATVGPFVIDASRGAESARAASKQADGRRRTQQDKV
jgi:hypothetical protein